MTVAVTDGTAFAGQVFQISVDLQQANRPAFTSDPPTQATQVSNWSMSQPQRT